MNAPATVDDRVTCAWCQHCTPRTFRCNTLRIGVLVELPRRCTSYLPLKSEADQRTGAQRWPRFDAQLAEARAADAAEIIEFKARR